MRCGGLQVAEFVQVCTPLGRASFPLEEAEVFLFSASFLSLRLESRNHLSNNTEDASLESMTTPLTRITIDPGVCGGQPCVRGLRIPVSLVLKHLAAGKTHEQVVDEFPELEPEDITECLRYAAWLASGRSVSSPFAA